MKGCQTKIWTEFKLTQEKIPEWGGSWMNLTNMLASKLVFFTVLGFLCSSTKILTSIGQLCFVAYIYFYHWVFNPKLNAEGRIWLLHGSNNTWNKLEMSLLTVHNGKSGCNITVEYTTSLSCVLIGCIFYGKFTIICTCNMSKEIIWMQKRLCLNWLHNLTFLYFCIHLLYPFWNHWLSQSATDWPSAVWFIHESHYFLL